MLRTHSRLVLCLAVSIWFATPRTTFAAPTVWSGLDLTFTRPAAGLATDPANQDRITDNVWLTRDFTKGIFNIQQENSYDKGVYHAPADTMWATNLNNAGKTIAASNWEDLDFTYWRDAYNGAVGFNILGRDAVVHLLTDDIYLDLTFTSWGGSTGGFTYMRAVAPTVPTTTGDYNENGVVDASDYVVWRKTLNQSVSPAGSGADGDESGMIDAGDYDFWRARFGNVVPGTTSGFESTTVPEPATAASSVLWLAILLARQFRRQ